MEYTNKDIIEKMRGFKEVLRREKQIAFEIEHNGGIVSGEDLIDAMSFKTGVTKISAGGQTTDVTPSIALSYAEKADAMNNQHLKELSEELYRISTESARLLYYVSLLPNLQAEVITFHYLEGNTVSQTSKKIDASEASVKNMLRTAVKELVHMYNYIRTRN